jgi:hypothetical protein
VQSDVEDNADSDFEDCKSKTGKTKRVRNKEKDRERYRNYRARMTDEQQEDYAEKARVRMQKYRDEHKNSGKKPSPAEKKKMRKKWKLAKRKQRENITLEKKAETDRRSLQRKVNSLSPQQFETLLQHTTPRKQQYLKRRGILNSPATAKRLRINTDIAVAFKQGLRDLQEMRSSEARAKCRFLGTVARRAKNASKVQAELNICFRSWRKIGMVSEEASLVELQSRKQRSDVLNNELKTKVKDFFAGHSFALPSKRYASKSVLTDTTKRIHKDFLEEHKELAISFSAFKKLRPKEMLTVNKMAFIGCVCEYCINVEYAVSFHCY